MLENKYEKEYWAKDSYVMGIDEAGRGPLCGPLVVACCVLPINYQNEAIDDSKKLTEKKRNLLFQQIIKDAAYEAGQNFTKKMQDLSEASSTNIVLLISADEADIPDTINAVCQRI